MAKRSKGDEDKLDPSKKLKAGSTKAGLTADKGGDASQASDASPAKAEASSAQGGGTGAAGSGQAAMTAQTPTQPSVQAGLTARTPTQPSQSDIDAGIAIPVKEYMKALIPYVQTRLAAFLKQKDSRFGGDLAEAPPFQISQDAKKAFKNFREPWQMSSCLNALTSTQLYEASGNVFWLDVLGSKFGEHDLADAEVTWHRLHDAAAIWSEEAFVSSCEDPHYRRFVFPGYLPAALANTSHIEAMVKSQACHFKALCVLGGHAIIYAWYVALADAFQAGLTAAKDLRIWKLYEAGMTATIRLRLTTSHTQVLTDAHVWSETIRATHMSGSCDLLNFITRLKMMPEVMQKGTSVEKMRQVLSHLGIQYRCKPVDKSIAMGVMALIPLVSDVACMKALSPIRELFPKLTNELSKMMRIAQVAKTLWGDTSMFERLSFGFESVFVALMRKDVQEAEITTSWVVGTDRGPGFLQMCGVKKSILDFMFRAVHMAVDHQELQHSSEAIINEVLPKFTSPIAMYMAFRAKHEAGLTAGDEAGMTADRQVEEGQQGSVGDSVFEKWLNTLENKGAKAAAQLFHDIHIGVYDEAYRSAKCIGLVHWYRG